MNKLVLFISFMMLPVCPVYNGANAAELHPELELRSFGYAYDPSATYRLELNLSGYSDERALSKGNVTARELNFYLFYESGVSGDLNFDMDNTLVRVSTWADGYLWLGRTHPFVEDSGRYVTRSVTTTSAIGSLWVQNDVNALDPRVSGWIGLGWSQKLQNTGIKWTLAYSPIFLPTVGPRVNLSSQNTPDGARFARLPPTYVELNGQLLPMHYDVQIGNIKDIILQDQVFVSLGHESRFGDFSVMAWSAPAPKPTITSSAVLKVNGVTQDVSVLATVEPYFARQTFFGGSWGLPSFALAPHLEAIYERTSNLWTISAQLEPFSFFKMGYLDTLGETVVNLSTVGAATLVPNFANKLLWAEISYKLFRSRLCPSLLIERSFADDAQGGGGGIIRPTVQYNFDKHTSLFASASVLNGRSGNYFGAWSGLSSVSVGGRLQW